MQTNILEYLENTVRRLPDKVAFYDENQSLTFGQIYQQARSIGSFLHQQGFYRTPIVVFMRRQPKTVAAFWGAVYAGCCYVPLDDEMPMHRIELILQTLKPSAVICDPDTKPLMAAYSNDCQLYLYDDISTYPIDEAALGQIRADHLDIEPLYILYTSGSTGVPKGVTASHRNLIDYIEVLTEVMGFNENTIYGNQTPFFFDASLKELIPTFKCGATTVMIPKQLFMFPVKLVEFMNTHKVNTICWVVSALTMISSFRTFEKIKPEYLHTVSFGSEVFPMKQFLIWKNALPHVRYVNLYGPTEITGVCCYYVVDRDFAPDEVLPIGHAFRNCQVLLLDENDRIPAPGDQGEICIRGTRVTLGYYRNPETTAKAFVQNPLNDKYPEIIYRTGDIGRYNERGELVFLCRKDYQIKHMGHRIELGEIEAVAAMHPDISVCCCVFDDAKKKIVLYYVGTMAPGDATAYLKDKLPRYMVPHVIRKMDAMPLSPNGKTDRRLLKEFYLHDN